MLVRAIHSIVAGEIYLPGAEFSINDSAGAELVARGAAKEVVGVEPKPEVVEQPVVEVTSQNGSLFDSFNEPEPAPVVQAPSKKKTFGRVG